MGGSSTVQEDSVVIVEVVHGHSITSYCCSILNYSRNIRSHLGCWMKGTTRNLDGSKVERPFEGLATPRNFLWTRNREVDFGCLWRSMEPIDLSYRT